MKTALLLLSLALIAPNALSEDVAITAEKEKTEATVEQQKKLQAAEERLKALEKSPVTYGGFVHDAARATSKKKFFSLRQKRDPVNDTKNLSLDERTGKPRGFVLFRVSF